MPPEWEIVYLSFDREGVVHINNKGMVRGLWIDRSCMNGGSASDM